MIDKKAQVEEKATLCSEEDEKKMLDDAFKHVEVENNAIFDVKLTQEEEAVVINKFFDIDEDDESRHDSINNDEIQEAIRSINKR